MSHGDAEVLLPDSIELSLQEAGDLLQALDDAEGLVVIAASEIERYRLAHAGT
jgi:hypothetical protein